MLLFVSFDILLHCDVMPEWRLCIDTVATLVHTYVNHTQLSRMCVKCLDILEPHPLICILQMESHIVVSRLLPAIDHCLSMFREAP